MKIQNMGMIPEEYFEAFVLGNYEDCKLFPGSVRLAFNASVSASHLADQYFKYNKKNNPTIVEPFNKIGEFVEYLVDKTSGCFRDIRSISNAYKHLYEDPKAAVYSTISSTGAIECISYIDKNAAVNKIEVGWTEESKNESTSKVIYTRKDLKQIEFLYTLSEVIIFWEKLIYQINDF